MSVRRHQLWIPPRLKNAHVLQLQRRLLHSTATRSLKQHSAPNFKTCNRFEQILQTYFAYDARDSSVFSSDAALKAKGCGFVHLPPSYSHVKPLPTALLRELLLRSGRVNVCVAMTSKSLSPQLLQQFPRELIIASIAIIATISCIVCEGRAALNQWQKAPRPCPVCPLAARFLCLLLHVIC
jgi:hypothetical protein